MHTFCTLHPNRGNHNKFPAQWWYSINWNNKNHSITWLQERQQRFCAAVIHLSSNLLTGSLNFFYTIKHLVLRRRVLYYHLVLVQKETAEKKNKLSLIELTVPIWRQRLYKIRPETAHAIWPGQRMSDDWNNNQTFAYIPDCPSWGALWNQLIRLEDANLCVTVESVLWE